MSNKERADKILGVIGDYLENCCWIIDDYTLLRIDPVTKAKYSADTAFCIQVARDLNS